jgi:hypothetical protein
LIVLDIEDLRASSAKLHNLPPPAVDLDAWVAFVIKSPKSWKKFVRALATSDSPELPATVLVTCSVCGLLVAKQGLGAHCARMHSMFRLARASVGSDGVCPVFFAIVRFAFAAFTTYIPVLSRAWKLFKLAMLNSCPQKKLNVWMLWMLHFGKLS